MTLISSRCVGCDTAAPVVFYEASNVPVDTGTLFENLQTARAAQRGRLVLEYCGNCGLVHNREFDPSLVRFAVGYDASLCYSDAFARAVSETADRLVDTYHLNGKSIVEVGCGYGHLLRAICVRARVEAVGIDPAVSSVDEMCGESRLKLIQSAFCTSHASLLKDLVLSVSLIEDIKEPLKFLCMLRSMALNRKTTFYFELFDGWGAIERGSVWSPHYEQCNYFSEQTIRQLFQRVGFEVRSSGRLKGCPDYLFVEAEAAAVQVAPVQQNHDLQAVVANFAESVTKRSLYWSALLNDWEKQGKRTVLWGTGGKGIRFLSAIPEADSIHSVVDINPKRQGKFTAGSAKLVIAPEQLQEVRPDFIVLSNAAYRTEVEEEVRRLGLSCHLVEA